MLKERLKEMDIRITELSEYLHISRPTMYKFIECYDSKQFKAINQEVLKLFNYIAENELIGKRGVITYILNMNVSQEFSDNAEIKAIEFLKNNPDSKKSKFIKECVTSETFDKIIFYLIDILPVLHKSKPDSKEEKLIAPYKELLNKIQNFEI